MKIRVAYILKCLIKIGRKVGSVKKTEEQRKAEDREVVSLLRKGYSIRDVVKLI